jgi:hypothetical protein
MVVDQVVLVRLVMPVIEAGEAGIASIFENE